MIKAVLFDMDGVLLDSEPFHDEVNLLILRKFGIDADKSVTNPFIGRTSEALWSELGPRFAIPLSIEELIELQWSTLLEKLPGSGLVPSKGLLPLLDGLETRQIRLTVASSSRARFVEAVLRYLDIWDRMEGFTCGQEVEHGKPAPDIFLLAAHKLGVSPNECMVIEDSTAGVAAGLAAGMLTIGYRNPTSDGQDISRADHVIEDLQEVIDILSSLTKG
jgi:HAD superfamily hydrolase (TIGR01509 family)